MFLDNAVRVKYLVTIQASFLLRRRRTLLANAIPWRSGVTARTGASPVPTIRRLGRPARRIVGVPLAGTLARFLRVPWHASYCHSPAKSAGDAREKRPE